VKAAAVVVRQDVPSPCFARFAGAAWLVCVVVVGLCAPARALIFGEPCGARVPLATAVVVDLTSVHEGSDRRIVSALCTGMFVRPDVVLTAAHCLDPRGIVLDEEVVSLAFAVSFLDDLRALDELPSDAVVASSTFVLPGFSFDELLGARGTSNDLDDAALLFFASPVVDVDAAFPFVDDTGLDRAGLAVLTAGYGATNPNLIDATRGTRTCGDAFFESVAPFEQQVGAGTGSLRACNGDSGGPLLKNLEGANGGGQVVVGVHSHVLNESVCDAPSVSQRVAPVFLELDQAARDACTNGARTACDPPGLLVRPIPIEDAGVVVDVDAGFSDAGFADAGIGDAGNDDDERVPRTGCAGCGSAALLLALPLLRRRRRQPCR
jgi:hypothetical protein